MASKNKKRPFSLIAYLQTNWRIPLAIVAIAIIATIASAAPQIFNNFQDSFTDLFLIPAEAHIFAKSGTSDVSVPPEWQAELNGHWAANEIAEAVDAGLIDADQIQFRPNDSINRAEMAMIMARDVVSDQSAWTTYEPDTFCDVYASAWFSGAVMTIYDAGLVKGYPTDACDAGINFNPGQNLTRAEAIKVILKAYDSQVTIDQTANAPFTDASLHWAQPYLAAAYELGIIHGYGDGSFKPDAPISRSEFIKMLMGAVDTLSADSSDTAATTDETTQDQTQTTTEPMPFNDSIPSI